MNASDKNSKFSLWLIVLYMFFEYVRPQSFIPGLAALHIPMFIQIAIGLALFHCNLNNLKSRESVLFFLFLCLMALHVPFATNNYSAYMNTRTMALQFIIFLGIVGFLRTHDSFRFVLTFWIIIAIICGAKGYFEGGRIPGSAFLGDENDFALFMNMMIPLTFFKGRNASAKKLKLLWYGGAVILILGNVASLSRGGFLGLLPPLFYCWWKTPGKIKTGVASLIVALILVTYVVPDSYWNEIRTITEEGTEKGTGMHRMYMWKRAWAMFLDSPLVGVGPGNVPYIFKYYEPYGGLKGRSEAGRAVHSIYLTLIPELGLAGAFLFFGMILSNLKEISRLGKLKKALYVSHLENNEETWIKIKNLEALGWGLVGAVIAYLISGAFLSVLYYGHFWLIMGFSVARNNLARELLHKIDAEPEKKLAYEINENSRDRWQYAGGAGDYEVPR